MKTSIREDFMIDRRTLSRILAGGVAASAFTPKMSAAQAERNPIVFYSAVGPDVTLYAMNVDDASLTKQSSVTLPANVQYAWPHPSRQYFYFVSSSGGPGVPGDRNFANAFRIDPSTGALRPHGEPRMLPSRPIHTNVDIAGEYLLTAYPDPSSLTVHRINADGTLGDQVRQPNALDTGKYAHQIRITPDNRNVILVTRGNNAPEDNPVNPGSIKIFTFSNGVLSNLAAIQPGDGMHFGPRHLDFHPSQPWVYVAIESQDKLFVYKRDPATGLSRDPLFIKETLPEPKRAERPRPAAVHIHPNGRFVYLTNRDSATVTVDGKKVSAGSQNNVAVFSIDPATGEPRLIDNADGHAFEMRTFAIDPSGRMLVAASVAPLVVRDGGGFKTVSAGLSVFRIGDDGKLTYVRKYDVDVGNRTHFWSGMVTMV
jgi:6-phosphogluconolactonase (cycloisomerase 2 family)